MTSGERARVRREREELLPQQSRFTGGADISHLGKNVARLSVIFNCADNKRSEDRNIGFVSE